MTVTGCGVGVGVCSTATGTVSTMAVGGGVITTGFVTIGVVVGVGVDGKLFVDTKVVLVDSVATVSVFLLVNSL